MLFFASVLLIIFAHLDVARGLPTSDSTTATNTTIVLPPGLSNHGDPRLICQRARWIDIAVFYLANYVAHAATIILEPGSSTAETVFHVLTALCFPGAGFLRALKAIRTRSIFAKVFQGSDLRTAARAGALCTALDVSDCNFRDEQVRPYVIRTGSDSWFDRSIHGTCQLPTKHILLVLPADAEFESELDLPRPTLSSNYNAVKVVVALAQTVYAMTTLYDTRGDQLQRFGYAAFGLTVTPYLIMSFLNLVANLIRPDYPTMFLVQSSSMDKLDRAHVAGAVGRLTVEYEQRLLEYLGKEGPRPSPNGDRADGTDNNPASPFPSQDSYLLSFLRLCLAACFVGLVPLAVTGAMTRFDPGHSTPAQRGWVMTWIVVGNFVQTQFPEAHIGRTKLVLIAGLLMLYCPPAVGGLVVVGRQISSYGVCKRI